MLRHMFNYWLAQLKRGEKLLTIYAIMHSEESVQPQGYVQAWYVSRRLACATANSLNEMAGNNVAVIKMQMVQ